MRIPGRYLKREDLAVVMDNIIVCGAATSWIFSEDLFPNAIQGIFYCFSNKNHNQYPEDRLFMG